MPRRSPDKLSPAAAARLLQLGERMKALGGRLGDLTLEKTETDPSAFDPRGLRIELDGALIAHGALVGLLCEDGIISPVRYLESLVDSLESELAEVEGNGNNGTDDDEP